MGGPRVAEQIFEKLSNAVIEADAELAKEAAEEALEQGIDAYEALTRGLMRGIEVIGEKFANKKYFISDVLMSAQAMQAGLKILEPHLAGKKSGEQGKCCWAQFSRIYTP